MMGLWGKWEGERNGLLKRRVCESKWVDQKREKGSTKVG